MEKEKEIKAFCGLLSVSGKPDWADRNLQIFTDQAERIKELKEDIGKKAIQYCFENSMTKGQKIAVLKFVESITK